MRSWNDFWKTKDEKDYEEFLTNPKEAYEKLITKFQEMDDDIQDKTERINLFSEEMLKKDQTAELLLADKTRLIDERDVALSMGNTETKALAQQYRELENELRNKLQDEYKLKYKQKEAELEKSYNHEVHTMVEEQQDKMLELVGNIVRESIIGFYNEKANKDN